MAAPEILLQTTIPFELDNWHVGRFSLLRDHLASLRNPDGSPRYDVLARNREPDAEGNDPVLSALGDSDVAELWLFAVDVGDGLSNKDSAGLHAFRRRGGGILTARDHQDLGLCLTCLHSLGSVNYFHSQHPEEDDSRRVRDDSYTSSIDYPNYHSGSNGDYQTVAALEPIHELLRSPKAPGGVIRQFPAHPHEGAVGPDGVKGARTIATGSSTVTHRPFASAVVLEGDVDDDGKPLGRAVAESTFHHFCDYNWDIAKGCPSFVSEKPSDGIARDPQPLEIFKDYVTNLAGWLARP
ncbi:MAG TPA: hypothetical protein VKG44_06005 [Candidatus Baltobacteraceae bacterium]|nr:hypothetical protein [Candidatus Baltobacteraceae bacterium]